MYRESWGMFDAMGVRRAFFVLLLGYLLRFFHLLFFLSEDLTLLNG
jgi:hypothetical protein